ncbi:LysR family transcriptional regulator [Gynuella sp.]|uniref:LysR family transcriptional regulator n=1 Tax=Gynuella sp. TaxID=2969146 RepID=UPI003D13F961
MLANIEALIALDKHQTMSAAALALRISQSAISKRIALLEQQLGVQLITKQGRKAVFTEQGTAFISKVSPLVADLNLIIQQQSQTSQQRLSIGVSEAILSSWGGNLLKNVSEQIEGLIFDIHAHRTPTVIDKIQSGHYQLGICAGKLPQTPGLVVELLNMEPMVILAKSKDLALLKQEREAGKTIDIIGIERKSNTWEWLKPLLAEFNLHQSMQVESSFAAAQLAISGFGHALVPLGVAKALNAMPFALMPDPEHLYRPSFLVCRKSTFNQREARKVVMQIQYFAGTL